MKQKSEKVFDEILAHGSTKNETRPIDGMYTHDIPPMPDDHDSAIRKMKEFFEKNS